MAEPEVFEQMMLNYLNGELIEGKLYFRPIPQNATFPHGVVFKILPGREYTHDGPAWYKTEMQISCFGKGFVETRRLANEVIKKMELWSEVQAVFLRQDGDAFEQEDQTHHVALVFEIHHSFDIL